MAVASTTVATTFAHGVRRQSRAEAADNVAIKCLKNVEFKSIPFSDLIRTFYVYHKHLNADAD
jgi:hypothetical protein